MTKLSELTAKLTALAQEYKQMKLSIAAKNPLANSNAKVAFSPEEAQDFNAKVNKFHGIKDKTQLDEAGKILAEELKTLIPAFLAKYVKVAEGQQKQLAGVKAKAEELLSQINALALDFFPQERPIFRVLQYTDPFGQQYDQVEILSWGTHPVNPANGIPNPPPYAFGIKVHIYQQNGQVGAHFLVQITNTIPSAFVQLANSLQAQPSTCYIEHQREFDIDSEIPFKKKTASFQSYAVQAPMVIPVTFGQILLPLNNNINLTTFTFTNAGLNQFTTDLNNSFINAWRANNSDVISQVTITVPTITTDGVNITIANQNRIGQLIQTSVQARLASARYPTSSLTFSIVTGSNSTPNIVIAVF